MEFYHPLHWSKEFSLYVGGIDRGTDGQLLKIAELLCYAEVSLLPPVLSTVSHCSPLQEWITRRLARLCSRCFPAGAQIVQRKKMKQPH